MTHKSQPNRAKPCAPLTLRLWPDTLSLPSGADEGTCNLIAACMMVFAIEFFVPALPASLGIGVGLAQHGAPPNPTEEPQLANYFGPGPARRIPEPNGGAAAGQLLRDVSSLGLAQHGASPNPTEEPQLANYFATSRRLPEPLSDRPCFALL